jgi:N-acetylmuramoyl-L-alanine amidase
MASVPIRRGAIAAAGTVLVPLLMAAASLICLGAGQEEAGGLAVTDVRFWSLGETTRVAIQTNGDFQYRHDRLSDPDRVYFDIIGAVWPVSGAKIHTIQVGDRLIKQIRVAQTQPNVTRVVFDLAVSAEFTAARLANPERLMVEFRPSGGRPPLVPPVEAAKPPEQPKAAETAKPPEVAKKTAPAPPTGTAAAVDDKVPQAAKRNKTGDRSLVRALGLKLGRVVIDPGHGGHDTGTIGPTGLMEKDLVLDVAKRLGALIGDRLGAEVIYTRGDDTFVPLEERTALANQKQADLFLSLHANSGVRSAAGSETYYLNFTTSQSALDVAARENASSEKTIHELQDLIQKIALKDKVDESKEFAVRVQAALQKSLSRTSGAVKDRGVRKAPFVVLIGASMPSVLAEIAFLSNRREERLLKQPDYRQKVAEALYKGLSEYASTLSHFQVANAVAR